MCFFIVFFFLNENTDLVCLPNIPKVHTSLPKQSKSYGKSKRFRYIILLIFFERLLNRGRERESESENPNNIKRLIITANPNRFFLFSNSEPLYTLGNVTTVTKISSNFLFLFLRITDTPLGTNAVSYDATIHLLFFLI